MMSEVVRTLLTVEGSGRSDDDMVAACVGQDSMTFAENTRESGER